MCDVTFLYFPSSVATSKWKNDHQECLAEYKVQYSKEERDQKTAGDGMVTSFKTCSLVTSFKRETNYCKKNDTTTVRNAEVKCFSLQNKPF